MVRSKRHASLTVLLCLTVLLAGCSGWGSDGPSSDGAEPDGTDDLEDAGAGDGDDEPNDSAANEGADDGDEVADEDEDTGDEDTDPTAESGTDEVDEGDTSSEESDDTSANEDDADGTDDAGDADEGGDDASDGSTLTVETADVVTGEPVDADVIALEQDDETVGEASGTSATFDGLEDGEYELTIYDDLGDWVYADTVTVDGGDATYAAEIDQEHTYWPAVEVTVVDGDGDPVEGETVMINGEQFETGSDGIASDEVESSYTDEREFVVEYGEQSETVEVDWETWDGEPETVTFEAGNGGEGDDNETAVLAITA